MYFRYYKICSIKITSRCKILILPEEGWFGQPKYSTHFKNHATLCRFLLLFSSFFLSHHHLLKITEHCSTKRFLAVRKLFSYLCIRWIPPLFRQMTSWPLSRDYIFQIQLPDGNFEIFPFSAYFSSSFLFNSTFFYLG